MSKRLLLISVFIVATSAGLALPCSYAVAAPAHLTLSATLGTATQGSEIVNVGADACLGNTSTGKIGYR